MPRFFWRTLTAVVIVVLLVSCSSGSGDSSDSSADSRGRSGDESGRRAAVDGHLWLAGFGNEVRSSTDGREWEPHLRLDAASEILAIGVDGEGRMVVSAAPDEEGRPLLISQADGEDPVEVDTSALGNVVVFYGIEHQDGVWIASGIALDTEEGDGLIVARSTDGTVWEPVEGEAGGAVVAMEGAWLALGEAREVFHQADGDGRTWTEVAAPSTVIWRDGTAEGGPVVVVGDDASISMSDDSGASWTEIEAFDGEPNDLYGIAYAEGRWIVVGVGRDGSGPPGTNPPFMAESTDARTWSRVESLPPADELHGVVHSTELGWIAHGAESEGRDDGWGPVVWTSDDGVNWTAQFVPGGYSIQAGVVLAR